MKGGVTVKTKKFISAVLCVVLLFVMIPYTGSAETTETQRVRITTTVNVRTAPGTWNGIVATIGSCFATSLGTEADTDGDIWYHITTDDGITGYVYSRYIAPADAAEDIEPIVVIDPDFEVQIQKFPESYRASLRALHSAHPKWLFVADYLKMSFEVAVDCEYNLLRKYVQMSYHGASYRSLQNGVYDWEHNTWRSLDGNDWTAASREVVAYYMDPRNFLDSKFVYMFLQQSYDEQNQTESGLSQMLSKTFLANNYDCNPQDELDSRYGGSYSKVIMAAAKQHNISPYVIAAKILAEHGGPTAIISGTVSGYENYYNFYNIQAYGENPVIAGLEYAKKVGWNSRAKAIIDGAQVLTDGYLDKGQDTYYYMDFNLYTDKYNPYYSHQYAASVYDAYNKGGILSNAYTGAYDNAPLVFRIPVFDTIPDKVSEKPASNGNLNNYYITEMKTSGLYPAFNMYVHNYSLSLSSDSVMYIKVPLGASVVSPLNYSFNAGNTLFAITVKAQTGYTDNYYISVNADTACSLTISLDDPPASSARLGDINGNGGIDVGDLAAIRLDMLGKKKISNELVALADINKNGQIDVGDLAAVRLHLLGKKQIPQ